MYKCVRQDNVDSHLANSVSLRCLLLKNIPTKYKTHRYKFSSNPDHKLVSINQVNLHLYKQFKSNLFSDNSAEKGRNRRKGMGGTPYQPRVVAAKA